jgi:hypothetical protein
LRDVAQGPESGRRIATSCRQVLPVGFRWHDGIGTNLQALPSGTQLGRYENGALVTLTRDATLIFPKKRPGLVELGKPLVQLARAV